MRSTAIGARLSTTNEEGALEMKVLFVCTGNSFRSPVAGAMMKKMRGDLEVESAGTQPADRIASNARRLLGREGAADYLKKTPKE